MATVNALSQAQAFILKAKGLGQAQTTITTHIPYAEKVIRDGATAYWKLDEASGTTAKDSIGTLDGIYTGSPSLNQFGPPLIPSAPSVTLTDSDSVFVDTPTPTGLPFGNSDRTIEAWYKSTSANNDAIFGYGDPSTRQQFVLLLNYNGNIGVSTYNEDPGFTVAGFNDGNWHYLSATYTGSSKVLEIWFNGVSKGTYTFSNNLNTVLTGSDIGRLYYANGFAFNGNLSNIAVYPTALSAGVILDHSIGGIPFGNAQAQAYINAIAYRSAQAQAYIDISRQPGPFTLNAGYVGTPIPVIRGHTYQVDFDVVGLTNANENWLNGLIGFTVINQHKGADLLGTTTPVHYTNVLTLDPTCTTVCLWTTVNLKTFTNLVYTDLTITRFSQALARIFTTTPNAQAQVYISPAFNQPNFGQAQAKITTKLPTAQAQVLIQHFTAELGTVNSFGSNIILALGFGPPKYLSAQAQAYISPAFNQPNFGQAQAKINAFGVQRYGQSLAYILPKYSFPLVYPGSSALDHGVLSNRITQQVFHVTSGQSIIIYVQNPPSDGGNIGLLSEPSSNAFDASNQWVNGPSANTYYTFTGLQTGFFYVYSWNGSVYRPSITGSGTIYFADSIFSVSAQAQAYISPAFNQPNFGQAQAFILKLKGLGQAQAKIRSYIIQSVTAQTRGGAGSPLVLASTPIVGNKLIFLYSQRDGTGPPAITGFTLVISAVSTGNQTHTNLHYRDVIAGDTTSWPFPNIGNDGRATLVEVTGLAPGTANISFGETGYGTPTTSNINTNSGLIIGEFASQDRPTLSSGWVLFEQGLVYENVDPWVTTYIRNVDAGTYSASTTLSAGRWTSAVGYWSAPFGNAQAQAYINAIQYRPAQAQAYISPAFNQPNFGQATADILQVTKVFAQAQTYVGHFQFSQAQAKLNSFNFPQFAQALSAIRAFNVNQFGQVQAFTLSGVRGIGQAQAYIGHFQFGQAQAYIGHFQFSQAQARMLRTYNTFGQANAQIGHQAFAQAQSRIISFNVPAVGLSQAFIRKSAGYANTQARIISFNIPNYGQSQASIKKLLGIANAQATIRHTYYGFAQANAYNLGPFWTGQSQTWTKQTYPVIGMDINYALVVNGASASDSTGQLLAPTNVIDGNDYGPDWSIGTGLNQTLNVDLGQNRLINFYRILPIRYDCTVNLQYSTDNINWSNAVIGIQFAVGFFNGVDTSRAVTDQIGPITARYWRLYVTNGGSNGGIAILSFELGTASVKSPTFAQAQAFIGHMVLAQAIAYISPGRGSVSGQTQVQIVITTRKFALSRAWIVPPTVVGQGVASILQVYRKSAQVNAWVIPPTVIAQSLATIKAYDVEGLAQATGDIKAILFRRANTQAFITKPIGIAQVQAQIKSSRSWSFGQSRVSIGHFTYSQAQAFVTKTQGSGQTMVQIKRTQAPKIAQAQASVVHLKGYAQSTADIKATQQIYGQAVALLNQGFGLSSVQTTILQVYWGFAQVNTSIKNIATNYSNPYGSTQAIIFITYYVNAQSGARVSVRHTPTGQVMAFIKSFKFGQAQAKINAFNYPRVAQAQGYIAVNLSTIVTIPNSESHSYLVRYNNYDLPGYAQDESYDSTVTITTHPAIGVDGSLSEYLGLTNKSIALRMRAWEPTYLLVKEKVQKAAIMLRSLRGGFAKLYVQQPNAYFLAMVQKISVQKDAKSSGKILDYIVDFEAKPWLISNDIYEVSGTGLISTNNRSISDGGWTPTTILVSGTDVTITAYTETGNYSAGSITIAGLCTNLVINSDNFTAIENGVNKNGSIITKDYAIHVGPGKTFFQVNGATSCVIQYHNRWYLSSTKKISTQTIATTVLPTSIIQSQYGQTGALISSGTKQNYAQVKAVINDPIKRSVATAQALLTSPITSVSGNAGGVLRNGRSWSFAQAQAGVLLPNVEGLGQAKALVEGATKYKSGQASAITTQPKRLVLGSARAVIY